MSSGLDFFSTTSLLTKVNGGLGCQRCLAIYEISVRHLTSCLICSTQYPAKSCCTGHAQNLKLLTETVGRKYIKAEGNFFCCCLFLLSNTTKSVLQVAQIFSTSWNLMSGEHFPHRHYWEHRYGLYICHILVLSFLEQDLPLKLCQDPICKQRYFSSANFGFLISLLGSPAPMKYFLGLLHLCPKTSYSFKASLFCLWILYASSVSFEWVFAIAFSILAQSSFTDPQELSRAGSTGALHSLEHGWKGRYFTALTIARVISRSGWNSGIIEISVKYSTGFSVNESILLSRLQHVINITIPNTEFFWGKKQSSEDKGYK